MVRLALLAGAAALLAGCNMVVTDAPLFKAERAAPVIRSGVWRAEIAGCAVDEAAPQDKWPACANATPAVPDPAPWILVAGDPDILELPLRINPKQAAPIVVYAAFRPLRSDKLKRVTAMKLWPVQCGPPPSNNEMKPLTKNLMPGLTPRLDVQGCTTADPKVLRAAAKASEAWALVPTNSHWVREKMSGDLDAPNMVGSPGAPTPSGPSGNGLPHPGG